jgi:hypothetical protein
MSKNQSIAISTFVSHDVIERKIFLIRGRKVMVDSDLAELYRVPTKALIQSIKRNPRRFPSDFMWQLTKTEAKRLRSQFVTSKGRGGRRYFPYVFTEQGVAMLSSVLNSDRAIEVNVQIMRTFMKLREILFRHKDLEKKIENLEKQYDEKFAVVFNAIKVLLEKAKKDTDHRRFNF